MSEAGGFRITYRTARVLTAIAANPEASNRAVAAAAGIEDEGQASKLLKRLERLGLVENTVRDRKPDEANAWRLTARGVELERAMRAKGKTKQLNEDNKEVTALRADDVPPASRG
jgi:DNA-binding MarR family transcriptional regulator